jgi:hypothetical protein
VRVREKLGRKKMNFKKDDLKETIEEIKVDLQNNSISSRISKQFNISFLTDGSSLDENGKDWGSMIINVKEGLNVLKKRISENLKQTSKIKLENYLDLYLFFKLAELAEIENMISADIISIKNTTESEAK